MVTSGGWEESAELFADLIERPSDEWVRLLDERCAGRPSELRTTVERLLSAHEAAEEHFLDSLDAESLQDVISDCATELERVGSYRLVCEVGRGGMGTVHLAERADGQFEQRVAVKMLKRGMDSEAILGRFIRERQILSRFAHPNIARLLDGGLADDGRPYLAMEYVEGEPIADYCARRCLSVERRLHLFRQVCAAVEYAHRNLVVHRDLKPSNIVVTGAGVPVLLDFGIAKLLSADDPGAGPDTRTAERWMTPEYAAPEQVRGDPPTVSTDVYQLGAVLYELLSGRKPVERGSGGLRELEHDILDREPRPPSAAAAATAADERGSAAARSARRLEGDLDTIVLKALRKEPGRRYASVAALDADIRRHLEGRPVEARPNTARYRTRRFIGRHRWGVAAAAAFVVLLAASVVMLAVQQRATVRQRDRAEQAAELAQRQAAKSGQVTEFLLALFEGSDPSVAQGDTLTARELLARGVARLEALAGQPDVQATLLAATGGIHLALGNSSEAEGLLRRSLLVWKEAGDRDEGAVAETRLALASALELQGRHEESLGIYSSLAAAPLPADAAPPADAPPAGASRPAGAGPSIRARALYGLYTALHALGRSEAADSAFTEWEAAVATQSVRLDARSARAMVNLGQVLTYRGETAKAERLLRRGVDAYRELYGNRHPDLGNALNALGGLFVERPPSPAADSVTQEALSVNRLLYPDGHPQLSMALAQRARILENRGQLGEAENLLREALTMESPHPGQEGIAYNSRSRALAVVLARRGALDEAETRLREARSWWHRNFGTDHPFGLLVELDLASVLRMQQDYTEAEAILLWAHDRLLRTRGEDDEYTQLAVTLLERLYEAWGRPPEPALSRGSEP